MIKKKNRQSLPKPLLKAQEHFSRWRSRQKPYTRIPDNLWVTAVNLSRDHGLSKTSKALGLSYYSLKKKSGSNIAQDSSQNSESPFLEIFPPEHSTFSECIIDLEDGDKTRMKIFFKGISAADLVDFSCRLWKGQS